jgi:aspartyl aminopeptidase
LILLDQELVPVLALKTSVEAALKEYGLGNEVQGRQDHHPALLQLISEYLSDQEGQKITPTQIVDFDLALYDTQPSTLGGLNGEFIFSGRLDNLFSS